MVKDSLLYNISLFIYFFCIGHLELHKNLLTKCEQYKNCNRIIIENLNLIIVLSNTIIHIIYHDYLFRLYLKSGKMFAFQTGKRK